MMLNISDPVVVYTLIASIALSFSMAPIGVFVVLRRMSLMAEPISHAILPGVAIAFILFPDVAYAMMVGGVISGLAIALMIGLSDRTFKQTSDRLITTIMLSSTALGVLILEYFGYEDEIIHMLFGHALHHHPEMLYIVIGLSVVSLGLLKLFYRPLMMLVFDPMFFKTVQNKSHYYQTMFYTIMILQLVAAFYVVGTVMSVGLMILPASIAMLLAKRLRYHVILATIIALVAAMCGLVSHTTLNVPMGPSMVVILGAVYGVVALLKPYVQKKLSC